MKFNKFKVDIEAIEEERELKNEINNMDSDERIFSLVINKEQLHLIKAIAIHEYANFKDIFKDALNFYLKSKSDKYKEDALTSFEEYLEKKKKNNN